MRVLLIFLVKIICALAIGKCFVIALAKMFVESDIRHDAHEPQLEKAANG